MNICKVFFGEFLHLLGRVICVTVSNKHLVKSGKQVAHSVSRECVHAPYSQPGKNALETHAISLIEISGYMLAK